MELNRKLKRIFEETIPRANFLTPIIIDYIKIGNHICEISKSHWDVPPKETLYGVSTITKNENDKWEYDSDLSKAFSTFDEAYKFINEIDKNE